MSTFHERHAIRATGLTDEEMDAYRAQRRFVAHVAGLVAAAVQLDDAAFAAQQAAGGAPRTAAELAKSAPLWAAELLEAAEGEEAGSIAFTHPAASGLSCVTTDDLAAPTADVLQGSFAGRSNDARYAEPDVPAEHGAVAVLPTGVVMRITKMHSLVLRPAESPADDAELQTLLKRAADRILRPRSQGIATMLEALTPVASRHEQYPHAEPPEARVAKSESVEARVQAIATLFEDTMLKRRPSHRADEDAWTRGGRDEFASSVRRYVAVEARILFVLPCFPFKSSNTDTKVLGTLPDMGEWLALRRLDHFLAACGDIHKPGARLVLFSDGRVYCDHFRIPDETTSQFKKAIRTTYKTPRIVWSDLDMFYPGLTDDQKREELEGLFGSSDVVVGRRIKEDPDFTEVYCGFKKFMREELNVNNEVLLDKDGNPRKLSSKQKRDWQGAVARRLMLRNYSYGAFVQMLFTAHVRLSIHPSMNTRKFSVNLLGESDWGTPWHNCALLSPDASAWSLVRRSVAEENGCVLAKPEDYDPSKAPWSTATEAVVASLKEAPRGMLFYVAQDEETVTRASPWASSAAGSPTTGNKSPIETPLQAEALAREFAAAGIADN